MRHGTWTRGGTGVPSRARVRAIAFTCGVVAFGLLAGGLIAAGTGADVSAGHTWAPALIVLGIACAAVAVIVAREPDERWPALAGFGLLLLVSSTSEMLAQQAATSLAGYAVVGLLFVSFGLGRPHPWRAATRARTRARHAPG